jgi:hypothetical protein
MTVVPTPPESLPAGIRDADSPVSPHRQLPRWLLPVLAPAAFAWALSWSASYPGLPWIGLTLSLVLCVAAVLLWLSSFEWNTTVSRRLVAHIVSAALVASSVGFTASGMPLRVRFAASVGAFESVVAEADAHLGSVRRADVVAAGDLDAEVFPIRCPARIGQFRISGCAVVWTRHSPSGDAVAPGGYLFLQSWDAITDSSGIAYLPDGRGRLGFWEVPRHLGGPWYSATCGC